MVRASYEQKPYRKIAMETVGRERGPVTGRRARPPRLAGQRDLRRGARLRRARRHPLRARVRPQPRAAAPDHDRAGGQGAAGAGGGAAAGRRDRALRWRVQPRRDRVPVRARRRRAADGRRAAVVPDAHPGPLRVRLRRRGGPHPAHADVHARPRLHPALDPRGWAALPRRLARWCRSSCATAGWRPWPTRRARCSRPPCSSPAPRARSPRRSAATRIRAAIDEALAAKETGEEKVILFNYCGHGFLDLSAYDDYANGRLRRRAGLAVLSRPGAGRRTSAPSGAGRASRRRGGGSGRASTPPPRPRAPRTAPPGRRSRCRCAVAAAAGDLDPLARVGHRVDTADGLGRGRPGRGACGNPASPPIRAATRAGSVPLSRPRHSPNVGGGPGGNGSRRPRPAPRRRRAAARRTSGRRSPEPPRLPGLLRSPARSACRAPLTAAGPAGCRGRRRGR